MNGDRRQVFEIAPRRHAELILSMVDGLLKEAGIPLQALDGLAFGRGPGAFTGVRIATGIIQGLAYAADLPVIPVSSLAALAQGVADRSDRLACAIDARMGEVYWGLYERGQDQCLQPIGEERVCLPTEINVPESTGWYGVGTGWGTYGPQLIQRLEKNLSATDPDCYPGADGVLTLAEMAFQRGESVAPAAALPVYLRDKVTG